ncbi:MAG: BMP family ABC transporter substrate-binding protein [Lachnospiraceae bacterium]|nr:BMP family ABC transporter substrate-binding protein [Lachnospiraceae bacterium]
MSLALYEKAKKSGDKAYKEAISKGNHPYLPVLDDIINREDIVGDVNLGLVNIPLDRVVGTATAGRTQAFAKNFMPIMNEKTEFGVKWSALCDSHLEEGIHDPIKVYEYLNYYYVVEGNKRVSVLKFFEADSVPAFVTRRVPKKTDDPEIRIYYEFMEFYKQTRVNFVWFSKEGSFSELMYRVGVDEDAPLKTSETTVGTVTDSADGAGTAVRQEIGKLWSEDTYLDFKSAYYRFERAYKAAGGDSLVDVTTGDAFLNMLELLGFRAICDMTDAQMLAQVKSMWQEFQVINEKEEVEVSMDAPDVKKAGLLTQLFTSAYSETNPLKVAFIYDREPVLSDWLYQHELGRNHLKEVFGNKIMTFKVTTAGTNADAVTLMENLIRTKGIQVIFTTTSRLIDASLKTAIKYPNVHILNCSLNTNHRYMRTYYTRLYEAKFLSGMVAGIMTKSNKIGYLADYPIFGVPANINAFALGVKMVNPNAKVYLKWTTLDDSISLDDIYRMYYEGGVDYLSDQDMITPKRASRRFGMYKLEENGEPVSMTMSVNNWGVFYERIINFIMNGAWDDTDSDNEKKAINYWWGFSSGVIEMIMSKNVPKETERLINAMIDLIRYDRLVPFEGEIRSQDSKVRNKSGERMEVDAIMEMDWLVDNVVGIIPTISELKDRAKQIVELKGVKKTEDEDPGNR